MITAIIAAGGRGQRLGAAVPKQLLSIGGRSMLQMSVEAFAGHPRVQRLVVVVPADLADDPPEWLSRLPKPVRVIPGGARRQDSVANGLAAIESPSDDDIIVIHDAARPFVEADLIDRAIDGAIASGAAICAVQAHDTVKLAADADDRDLGAGDSGLEPGDPALTEGEPGHPWIERTLPRGRVFLAQTPQAFRVRILADAVRLGQSGVEGTDEAFLAERAGHRVRLVEGSTRNVKITSREDLAMARAMASEDRIGLGYDVHRLVEGRRLVLGGVEMPFERGLLGHSDADVVCHAITDAVLGAAAAGDIGVHFPDTDPRWRDASSLDLLRQAVCLVHGRGLAVSNVDAVVIAERPKIGPHVSLMIDRLADALQVSRDAVSVKGKTNEGQGEIGRGEAIACQAVAMLRRTSQ